MEPTELHVFEIEEELELSSLLPPDLAPEAPRASHGVTLPQGSARPGWNTLEESAPSRPKHSLTQRRTPAVPKGPEMGRGGAPASCSSGRPELPLLARQPGRWRGQMPGLHAEFLSAGLQSLPRAAAGLKRKLPAPSPAAEDRQDKRARLHPASHPDRESSCAVPKSLARSRPQPSACPAPQTRGSPGHILGPLCRSQWANSGCCRRGFPSGRQTPPGARRDHPDEDNPEPPAPGGPSRTWPRHRNPEARSRATCGGRLGKRPPDSRRGRKELVADRRHAEGLPELSPDMQADIARALGPGPQEEVLSRTLRLSVTRGALQTLAKCQWLNDDIINFYMDLLVARSHKQGWPRLHAFSTFFYPKLRAGGYQAVRRWTKGLDLFQHHLLLVPIHQRAHWSLLFIDLRKKAISYLDSLGGKDPRISSTMLHYLQEESRSKRNTELDLSEWTLDPKESWEIPRQSNGSDCGVFLCKYADYISQDKPFTFTQNHMPHFRRTMVWEILHQQLL